MMQEGELDFGIHSSFYNLVSASVRNTQFDLRMERQDEGNQTIFVVSFFDFFFYHTNIIFS